MPYRRLPKTDEARLRALKIILGRDDLYTVDKRVLEWKTLSDAQAIYAKLDKAHSEYKTAYRTRTDSSSKYQKSLKTTRLFISHFIQVLNMSMLRGEIKEENKELYGLTVGDFTVPDLLMEQQVVEWGAKIITGERERLKLGGVPIYNPTIAKVSVQYDIFMSLHRRKKQLHENTDQHKHSMCELRAQADAVILTIWDEVEEHFKSLPVEQRFSTCSSYGVVYYYRRGEPHTLF